MPKVNVKSTINVLGSMSGTSMDAIDFALCKISLKNKKIPDIKLIDSFSVKYPKNLLKKLTLAANDKLKTSEITNLHFELGKFYSNTIDKHKKSRIDLVGIHGQTVYHNEGVSSLQICEPSFIAHKLKAPVVSNFRSMHIAVGGLGAPIANFFHQAISNKIKTKSKAFQNIGGIANVTYLEKNKIIAFDTGPGNMLIDGFMNTLNKKIDLNGKLAMSGTFQKQIVNSILKLKVFEKNNFGREQFGEEFLKKIISKLKDYSIPDKVATISELTVSSIVRSYKKLPKPPETIVLCGGGAKNQYILKRLQESFKNSKVITSEDIGWPVSMIEPVAIALLAAYRFCGVRVTVDTKKGSVKTLLGEIT